MWTGTIPNSFARDGSGAGRDACGLRKAWEHGRSECEGHSHGEFQYLCWWPRSHSRWFHHSLFWKALWWSFSLFLLPLFAVDLDWNIKLKRIKELFCNTCRACWKKWYRQNNFSQAHGYACRWWHSQELSDIACGARGCGWQYICTAVCSQFWHRENSASGGRSSITCQTGSIDTISTAIGLL